MKIKCKFDDSIDPILCSITKEYFIKGNRIVDVEHQGVSRAMYKNRFNHYYTPINLIDFPLTDKLEENRSLELEALADSLENQTLTLNDNSMPIFGTRPYHSRTNRTELFTIPSRSLSSLQTPLYSSLGMIYDIRDIGSDIISVSIDTNFPYTSADCNALLDNVFNFDGDTYTPISITTTDATTISPNLDYTLPGFATRSPYRITIELRRR